MKSAIDTLNSFSLDDLPNLDLVVLGALTLFESAKLPAIPFDRFNRPLVIGSVNAAATGKILFKDTAAYFADESNYQTRLDTLPDIDGVVLISASGGKHAIATAQAAKEKQLPTLLITNNPKPPAASYIESENIYVFPKNREPYTYNTSTYLGMILSQTREDASAILAFLMSQVEPKLLRNLGAYGSFVFILPAQFAEAVPMVRTKFDELFGPYVQGRVFTEEEIKHAKTVVTSGDELFIAVGVENKHYGIAKNRLNISLPEEANFVSVLATCYYLVGAIQKEHPDYFKTNIVAYTNQAAEIFGHEIKPIVE